jgi:hypothetical protein
MNDSVLKLLVCVGLCFSSAPFAGALLPDGRLSPAVVVPRCLAVSVAVRSPQSADCAMVLLDAPAGLPSPICRNNPVAWRDPYGAEVLFTVHEVPGKDEIEVELYFFLRYESDKRSRWSGGGLAFTKEELEGKAKEHGKILAKYLSDQDVSVEWKGESRKVRFKPHFVYRCGNITDQQHMTGDEIKFTGVTVTNRRNEKGYNAAYVPDALDKDSSRWVQSRETPSDAYARLLAHEIVGHHLSNADEYEHYENGRNWRSFKETHSYPPEPGSLMNLGSRLLPRHVDRFVRKRSNVTGLHEAINPMTMSVDEYETDRQRHGAYGGEAAEVVQMELGGIRRLLRVASKGEVFVDQ